MFIDVAAAAIAAAAAFTDVGTRVLLSHRGLLRGLALFGYGARQQGWKGSDADLLPGEESGRFSLVLTRSPLSKTVILKAHADDLLHTTVTSLGRGHHVRIEMKLGPVPIRVIESEVRPLGHFICLQK